MNSRQLVPPLLVLAALVYACGPRSHSDAATRSRASKGADIASSLNVDVGTRVEFALNVTNNSAKNIELLFPSGQVVDFVVTDTLGRPVWRWSDGRMFTQALQSQVLGSAESKTFSGQWNPDTLHGAFIAIASLRSENHPVEQRTRFELR